MTGNGRRFSNLNFLKGSFSIILAIYGFSCARSVEEGCFLDRVNLIPHEAGHLLFSIFGQFIGILGGTVGQLLVPCGIAIYFASRRELYSTTVAVFWLGQNLLGISVYANDAAAMELPLVSLGGADAIHDWNYMLLRLNLLPWHHTIGNFIYGSGAVVMSMAVILAFYLSFERQETVTESSP